MRSRWAVAAGIADSRIVALVLALAPGVSALWPVPARAQAGMPAAEKSPPDKPRHGQVALEYVLDKSAAGCPEETVLRERTAPYFDHAEPFAAPGTSAPQTIRVAITRIPGGYRSVVSILQEGRTAASSADERATCEELVWSLASWMREAIEPEPAAPCPACPRGEGCPAPRPCPAPEPPGEEGCDEACIKKKVDELCRKYGHCPNMGPTLTIMGGGLITAGWAAVVGPGAWLGGEVKWEHFSIGIEARGTFPTEAQRYYKSPPTSDLFSFSGLIVPCGRWKILFGCGLVEVGQWTFTVPNSPQGNNSDLLFSLGLRGGVDVPLAAGFSLRGFADLAFHPVVGGVDVDDLSDPKKTVRSWTEPWISGFFGIGVGWSK